MTAPLTDDSIMPFGKHKGKQLADVPADYLLYAYHNFTNLDKGLRAYIDDNWDVLVNQLDEK